MNNLILKTKFITDIRSGFALFTPFRMYLVARNSILLHANNKGADQPTHPRQKV